MCCANQTESIRLCAGCAAHPAELSSLWEGAGHPLPRSRASLQGELMLLPKEQRGVKRVVWRESVGVSGIRRDPPYAYYLLVPRSLPLMVAYVRVSWYSLTRAFSKAG